MSNWKYCKEWEKVDYFYDFKKCATCGVDNLKKCITFCLNWKIIFAKTIALV